MAQVFADEHAEENNPGGKSSNVQGLHHVFAGYQPPNEMFTMTARTEQYATYLIQIARIPDKERIAERDNVRGIKRVRLFDLDALHQMKDILETASNRFIVAFLGHCKCN